MGAIDIWRRDEAASDRSEASGQLNDESCERTGRGFAVREREREKSSIAVYLMHHLDTLLNLWLRRRQLLITWYTFEALMEGRKMSANATIPKAFWTVLNRPFLRGSRQIGLGQ